MTGAGFVDKHQSGRNNYYINVALGACSVMWRAEDKRLSRIAVLSNQASPVFFDAEALRWLEDHSQLTKKTAPALMLRGLLSHSKIGF